MTIYFNLSNQNLPISIETIGNQWPQVSLQRMQGYPLYHWLQSERGSGEIWIEQKKIILKEGEGILFSPFVPHAYYPYSEDWLTNFVTFEGNLKNSFTDILSNQSYILEKDTLDYSFSKSIEKMIDICGKDKDEITLSTLCYQFLLRLGQSHKSVQNHHLFKKYVLPGIQEIQKSYSNYLTVEEISKKLFITPQYFSRLFKKFMGQSPYQYLLDFRIRQAKILLINEQNLPIHIIANRVGIESSSQFIDIFKKRTNYTPKKFRSLYVKQV